MISHIDFYEIFDFLPDEIIGKINIFSRQSLRANNPELYNYINNFDYKSHFTFKRRIEFAKRISRLRVKYRVREKIREFEKSKQKHIQNKKQK